MMTLLLLLLPPQMNTSYTESVVAEWIMGAAFIFYNMSFVPEFYEHSFKLAIQHRGTEYDQRLPDESSPLLAGADS